MNYLKEVPAARQTSNAGCDINVKYDAVKECKGVPGPEGFLGVIR